jgi:hypothetical protein
MDLTGGVMFGRLCRIDRVHWFPACCFIASLAAGFSPAHAGAQLVGRKLTAASVSALAQPAPEIVPSVSMRGERILLETPNFRIWARLGRQQSVALAKRCEQARRELQTKWLPETVHASWNPKADVVVHPSADEYRRVLGTASDGSSGCVTITEDHGRVVQRRIDLRSDAADWSSSSLPHEMTHLVLADRFPGRRLSRWADEGMAVLAESQAKRSERRRAAEEAGRAGRSLPISQVMFIEGYPAPDQRAAFYAQSAALVEALVARGGPQRFFTFLDVAMRNGNARALKEVYGIDGIDESQLPSAWKR